MVIGTVRDTFYFILYTFPSAQRTGGDEVRYKVSPLCFILYTFHPLDARVAAATEGDEMRLLRGEYLGADVGLWRGDGDLSIRHRVSRGGRRAPARRRRPKYKA